MVTSTRFELVNAAVKGRCVKPLHQLAKKMAPQLGLEPRTPWLTVKCSNQLSYWGVQMVGLNGLEPSTSRLSGVRSNHLSYKPISSFKQLLLNSTLKFIKNQHFLLNLLYFFISSIKYPFLNKTNFNKLLVFI